MGKDRALSDGVVKKIILSYTYVTVWIFLSFTVIVYNKDILDKKLYNWPFPISLTMIHMAFCSSSLSPPSASSNSSNLRPQPPCLHHSTVPIASASSFQPEM
ncbi:UNVERIFIED_CONTAM: putative sugar phosphate/phosphate translocator [Sesamum latifolium]|uniref:Sugar phosphate/phosphate translocator n=1 Tax=Sesamum latifolium TaxID=2727402 RepID=A0AAW2XI82_9LAMI